MGVVVERIRPERWRELRALRLAALADAPGAFLTTLAEAEAFGDDEWRRRADEWAAGDAAATFLATVDGTPAGLVGGHVPPDLPGTVELVAMWTAAAHRRAGVGAALVEAVVTWAGSIGAGRVVLWVMRGNDGAAAFYRRVGFVDTDEIVALATDPCAEERRMVRAVS